MRILNLYPFQDMFFSFSEPTTQALGFQGSSGTCYYSEGLPLFINEIASNLHISIKYDPDTLNSQ